MWAGYRRVSRVGDRAERLISPKLQAARIEAYASARGLEVAMLEPELDVSGAKVVRPILEDAIERVEGGEFEGIIVAQIDRLSRMELADALSVLQRIEAAGGQVIAVAENIDASTPEGRFARNLFLSLAGMQRDRYRAGFDAAKRSAVERGVWPVSRVPLGYRKGEDRRLVPSRQAGRVRRAFELRAMGQPWSRVARELGLGISGAMRLLRNRVYLGEVRMGELVNHHAHPPIISRDLYEAAQLRQPPPSRGHTPLLGGLVRCAGCGCLMSIDRGKGVYRCQPRKAGWRCPEPAIIATSIVEPAVERTFLREASRLWFRAGEGSQVLEDAQRRLEAAEGELAAYQEAERIAELGPEVFARGMRKRAEAVEEARRELGRSRAPVAISGDVGSLWPDLSVEEKRHLLRGFLGVVWVKRGTGAQRIRISSVEPPDLPRPGFRRGERFVLDWDADLDGEVRVSLPKDIG